MEAVPLRAVASPVFGLPDGNRGPEESGPSVSLRLGIGDDDDAGAREKAVDCFTHAQLNKLCHHSLANNCLAAPLPVPCHLLLLLGRDRNGDAGSSLFPVNDGALKHQSTSVGFRREALDYMNRMSPELGRCRRTDGKKWQCRKAAIPHRKYCERHINRGCGRSRKPVEVPKIASPSQKREPAEVPKIASPSEARPAPKPSKHDLGPSKADIVVSLRVSTGFSLESTSGNKSTFNGSRDACGNSVVPVNSSSRKPMEVRKIASPFEARTTSKTMDLGHLEADIPVGLRIGTGISPKFSSVKKNALNGMNSCGTSVSAVKSSSHRYKAILNGDGKRGDRHCADHRPNLLKNGVGMKNGIKSDVLPKVGVSPKSVVQGHPGPFLPKIEAESDPDRWRCRRTDGKKWRCYRDVVPDQKYCWQHMHRGSKKPPLSHPLGASVMDCGPSLVTSKIAQSSDPANLNTSLTISTSTTSQKNEKSCNTSGSV